MQVYFSKITCGSRTKIHSYLMDLYLFVAKSKVQIPTYGKWRPKHGNRLLGNHKHTDAEPKKYWEKRVRHFLLYEQLQIFWYGNTLTNKYCKTGTFERTLLRARLVEACMHVSYLTRTVLLILHVCKKFKQYILPI